MAYATGATALSATLRESSNSHVPTLVQLRLLRIWIGRDFRNELVEDRLPERVEVLGDHDEGPRAANHVVSVVIIEAARRIGVVAVKVRRILGQNDEAIDGQAFGESFVTRNGDDAAGIEPVSAETQPVSGQPRTQISDIENPASRDTPRKFEAFGARRPKFPPRDRTLNH